MSKEKEKTVAPEEKDVAVEKELGFNARVWNTLSRIDVSDHVAMLEATAKRPAIGYLPWHKAWILVKRKFPGSIYYHKPDITHPDGTVEVEVEVFIMDDSEDLHVEKFYTSARLAVMNMYFGAIEKPNARDINDARQRCLVKALAFAGLGLNLWSESNIPVGKLDDPISTEQYEDMMKLIESTETDEAKFREWCEVDRLADMPFERYHSAMSLLEAKARRRGKSK